MFDPYHKWLGIPPEHRPPTFYQLLGLATFEGDAEVIEAAAYRQATFVAGFRAGPFANDAARILGEVALARAILTDPVKKLAYDAALGQALTRLGSLSPSAPVVNAFAGFHPQPGDGSPGAMALFGQFIGCGAVSLLGLCVLTVLGAIALVAVAMAGRADILRFLAR